MVWKAVVTSFTIGEDVHKEIFSTAPPVLALKLPKMEVAAPISHGKILMCVHLYGQGGPFLGKIILILQNMLIYAHFTHCRESHLRTFCQ